MKCKYCDIDAKVEGSHIEVTGDQSPDTTTEVYRVLSFVCRNPQCEQMGKTVGETKIKLN